MKCSGMTNLNMTLFLKYILFKICLFFLILPVLIKSITMILLNIEFDSGFFLCLKLYLLFLPLSFIVIFFFFNNLTSFKLLLFVLFLLSKFKDFDKILFSPVFYNTLSFLIELYKIINIFILVFLLIIFLLKNYKNKYSFFVLPVIGKGKKVEKEQVVTEDTGSGFEIFGFWRYSKKKSTTVYVNEDLKKFEETSVSHGSFSPKLEKTFKAEKAENAENGFEVTKTVSVTPSNFLSSFSKNNTPEDASLPSAISTVEYLLL